MAFPFTERVPRWKGEIDGTDKQQSQAPTPGLEPAPAASAALLQLMLPNLAAKEHKEPQVINLYCILYIPIEWFIE